MKPRILLDVDGVVCDFQTPALDAIERVSGTRPPVDDYEFLSKVDKTHHAACWAAMNEPAFCSDLMPYDGARAFVDALRDVSRVVFVTSPMRGLEWEGRRRRWLIEHMGADWADVISAADKTPVSGFAFLDDGPSHVRAWRAEHPGSLALLWNRPYNAGVGDLDPVRVSSYPEAFLRIQQRAAERSELWGAKP